MRSEPSLDTSLKQPLSDTTYATLNIPGGTSATACDTGTNTGSGRDISGLEAGGEDVDMEDTDNIHDDTTEKANVAAGKLITIEERAEKAYNEFQTATTRAKIAEERATVALDVAKSTKALYENILISVYRELALQAEEKAICAVNRSKAAEKELELATDNLRELIISQEFTAACLRQAGVESENRAIIEDDYEDMEGQESTADDAQAEPSDNLKNAKFTLVKKAEAAAALEDIKQILKPKRDIKGNRYTDPGIDSLTRKRLEGMKSLLWCYTDPTNNRTWNEASLYVANTLQRGTYHARMLRDWARSYIGDRTCLPVNVFGTWGESMLDQEDFSQELNIYLQSVGKYVTANHLMQYTAQDDVKKRWKIKDGISHATAKRWMHQLGYRWTSQPSGQYVDGHEREDVVDYRQNIFLPAMAELEARMRSWKDGTTEEEKPWPFDEDDGPRPFQNHAVLWFHDESTFYANDRRKVGWVHKDAKAVPRPKGEGASLMVADFISADYGWLKSIDDPSKAARVLFKAGIDRQGYFDNKDVLEQTRTAMDILEQDRPHEHHVFVFDNATTHTKRADDALSARRMPKNVPPESSNFFVQRNKVGPDGKTIYGPNRKPLKESVKMGNGKLADGTAQGFYFPDGHIRAATFKGMAIILEERGYTGCIGPKGKRAECPKFKCKPGATDCCCRRILYNEPDFVNVPSLLEIECNSRGFQVLFLPKFHCELNFIEQCWGFAKRTYRKYPESSKEADLEKNVIDALASVPIESMRRCIKSKSHEFLLTDGFIPGLQCALFDSWMDIGKD